MEGMERNTGTSYFLAIHVCPVIVRAVLNIEAPMRIFQTRQQSDAENTECKQGPNNSSL
jgi:hypothetical protein